MSFYQAISFLRDLNKNNDKAWMDSHRAEYEEARDFLIGWTEDLNSWFAQINWSFRNATKAIGFQSIDKQASLWFSAHHMGARSITRKIQAILGCITLYVAFPVFVEPLE